MLPEDLRVLGHHDPVLELHREKTVDLMVQNDLLDDVGHWLFFCSQLAQALEHFEVLIFSFLEFLLAEALLENIDEVIFGLWGEINPEL